ncbi:MAG: hypothetical protein WCD07_03110 [Burkholderiales bacterium]
MKFTRTSFILCLFSVLATAAIDASAATIRVQCEQRGGRSKVSVDADGLAAGSYRATAVSGGNSATSANAQSPVGGQVEFDFDSDAGDIAAGATAISSAFLNGSVTGKIVNSNGATVISDTVACRVRRR